MDINIIIFSLFINYYIWIIKIDQLTIIKSWRFSKTNYETKLIRNCKGQAGAFTERNKMKFWSNCKNCFFRSIHFHLRLKKTHIRMRGIGEFHSRLVLLRSTNTVIRKLSHVQLIAIFHPSTRISWHLAQVLFFVINEYIQYKWKFKVRKLHACKFYYSWYNFV